MNGGRGPRDGLMRVTCPHCDFSARTRSSKQVTPLYREIYYQCLNVHCGHTFVAELAIIRTLCPSQTPRADVHISLVPPSLRRGPRPPPAANDQTPAAANDDTERIEPPPGASALN